ncbi:MAG: sigma-70 family RNA polymerase sigma factor [Planctomycetes bacterium]|nr:sigma-70 family RNA polymerase sigma factor [Planctomycetota bacterium]
MSDSFRSPAAEALLQRSEWVRALARRMLVGFDAAEDLAQDALVAALQRQAQDASAVPERSWFAGVLRKRWRFELRSRRRRVARERRVARSELAPDTHAVVERASELQRVVETVLQLDEPHRSAVLLRYFEELEPAVIAARLGLSEEAARKRVSRGLQELRKKLARREGGLAALWPLTGWQPLSTGVGAATMSAKPLAWIGAVAALACLGWIGRDAFRGWIDGGAPQSAELRTSENRENASEARDAVREGAAVRATSDAARGASTESAAASDERGKRVRVRSIDGVTPIAEVAALYGFERGSTQEAAPVLARSDAEGALVLPAVLPAAGLTLVHTEHFARHFDREALRALPEDGAIELCPLGLLRIRVVDAGGAPLEGRDLYLELDSPFASEEQRWSWRSRRLLGRSGADGRLESAGWPCGSSLRVCVGDTWKGGVQAQIDLRTRVAEVQVTPHEGWSELRGSVVLANGAPAPGVEVEWFGTPSAGGRGNTVARTDERGQFRLVELTPGAGELSLGTLQPRGITAELFEGRTTDVGEIELAPERPIGGKLVSALPIDFAALRVVLYRDAVRVLELTPRSDGSFAGAIGEGPLLLIAERRGWYDPILPHEPRGLGSLELASPGEGLEVELDGPFGVIAFELPANAALPLRIQLYDELLGDFEWDWLATHRRGEIEAPASGARTPLYSAPLRSGRYRAVLRCGEDGSAGGAFSGVIEVAPGRLATESFRTPGFGALEMSLSAAPEALANGGKVELQDAEQRTRAADLDTAGRASFSELPPGPYLLRASCGSTYAAPRILEIHAGATARVALEVAPKALLRGRLLGKQGPLAQQVIHAQRMNSNRDWTAHTDANGVFAFEPLEPGSYRCWSSEIFVHTVTLQGGETRELELVVGERHVVVQVEREEKPWVGCSTLRVAACAPGHGVELVWRQSRSIGEGRFEVDLPSGPLLFQLDVPGLGNNQALLVQTPPHEGTGALVIAPHATGLLVEASVGLEHMPPPAAYLLELASGPVHSSWGRQLELQRERRGLGRAAFPSLPPGAKVRLVGIGARGEELTKELVVEAGGLTRVAWP